MYYFQVDSKVYRGEREDGKDKKIWKVAETAKEAQELTKRMLWSEVISLAKGYKHVVKNWL